MEGEGREERQQFTTLTERFKTPPTLYKQVYWLLDKSADTYAGCVGAAPGESLLRICPDRTHRQTQDRLSHTSNEITHKTRINIQTEESNIR